MSEPSSEGPLPGADAGANPVKVNNREGEAPAGPGVQAAPEANSGNTGAGKTLLFVPTSALLQGGVKLLAYEHPHYTVVITEGQRAKLKEFSLMDAKRFDEIWKELTGPGGIQVKPEPSVPPDVQLDPELHKTLDKVRDEQLRKAGKPSYEKRQIRDQRAEILETLARMKAFGACHALVYPPATEFFQHFPEIKTVLVQEFREQAKPQRAIHREIHWARIPYIIIFAVVFLGYAILVWAIAALYELQEGKNETARQLASWVWSLPVGGLAPACFVIGFLLYFWRCRHRLSYGFLELTLGSIGAVIKIPGLDARDDLGAWVTLFLALYVIARGFDNIGKGGRQCPWLGKRWPFIFGEDL